jgi:hypothetical protein
VVEDAAGLVHHVPERHREGLEVWAQALQLRSGQGVQQVVFPRVWAEA